ncbi:MAG: Ig-like domain-containing protein [Verrucomicrobiota bacterium]
MKTLTINRIPALCGKFLAAAGLLCACLPASAYLVDPFTSSTLSPSWTFVPASGGSNSYSPHALTVYSGPGSGALSYSKNSAAYSIQAGNTLELKVKVNGIGPAGFGNGHAVLAWVPTGSPLLTSSFNVRVGVGDIQIRKGSTVLYGTNLVTQLPTTNIWVVLRLTPNGANQEIRASVYSQAVAYAPPFNSSLLFEYTATNTTSIASSGNLALGAENSPSGAAATATFDVPQQFDTINTVIDPLTEARPSCAPCGGQIDNGWLDIVSNPIAWIMETNNTLGMGWDYDTGLFMCFSVWQGQTFAITDGARVQFSVDVPVGNQSPYNAPILIYTRNTTELSSLIGYYIAQNPYLVGVGKSFASYSWINPFAGIAANPNNNVRFTQIMTGEGTQVRVESRIEDLSKDLNDPTRFNVRTEFLDGPSFGGAFTNANGYFALTFFHNSKSSGQQADFTAFTNAVASYTAPVNRAPIISSLAPKDGEAFVDSTRTVSFKAADDVSMPAANISLTLNGVTYNSASPGVTVTGSTATKTFTLTGALSPNVFYQGTITATDNTGLAATLHYEFDTFLTNDFVIESEEFNFSRDTVNGGVCIDNPLLVPENFYDINAYYGVTGLPEIDFHDNQTSVGPNDHVFRFDYPHTDHSSDGPRAKYVNAGGTAAGYYEDIVTDIKNGDWLNYTHSNYPAGPFNVFLRQSAFDLPRSLVTLERVLGDFTQPNTNTIPLGSFLQLGDDAGDTGYDVQRTVKLTDSIGNPVVLRLPGGVDTFRVSDRFVDDNNNVGSQLFQNYLVLVPVAEPGTLRPVLSMTWPLANSTARISPMPETCSASIANRDTTVVSNTIALSLNGTTVPTTITMVTNASGIEVGANVTWSFVNTPAAALLNAKLTFQDNTGAHLTNIWSYSYPFLAASKTLPSGSYSTTNVGWSYRMAQTDGGNPPQEISDTITRAILQLESPPEIPADRTFATNNLHLLYWGDQAPTSPLTACPGLDLAPPLSYYYNIAVQVLGYAHLTPGPHRFSYESDEQFQMWLGLNLNDPSQLVVAQGTKQNGTNTSFDFLVETDGVYPIQIIWENSRKNYNFALYSVDLATNTRGPLINDTGSPVQVYSSAAVQIVPLSATTANGPYTVEASATVNQGARTITVPVSGSAKFFRIYGTAAPAITTITAQKSGSNIILHY